MFMCVECCCVCVCVCVWNVGVCRECVECWIFLCMCACV